MLLTKHSSFLFILLLSLAPYGVSQQNPGTEPSAPTTTSPDTSAEAQSSQENAPEPSSPPSATTKTAPPILLANPELRDQQEWLTVGNKKIPALYLSQVKGGTHGGVLLIPNLNMPPSQRGIINSLRNALPESHWHTLALDLSTVEPLTEQEISQSVAAGLKFLNDDGIYNIAIIAEGVGAARAIHFLADLSAGENALLQSIRALIIIDANNNVPNSTVKTLEKFSTIAVPILDAYSANNQSQQRLASLRKRAMYKNKGQSGYRQITLPRQVNYYNQHENHITKRIRGWMDKNISGFTVEKRRL